MALDLERALQVRLEAEPSRAIRLDFARDVVPVEMELIGGVRADDDAHRLAVVDLDVRRSADHRTVSDADTGRNRRGWGRGFGFVGRLVPGLARGGLSRAPISVVVVRGTRDEKGDHGYRDGADQQTGFRS